MENVVGWWNLFDVSIVEEWFVAIYSVFVLFGSYRGVSYIFYTFLGFLFYSVARRLCGYLVDWITVFKVFLFTGIYWVFAMSLVSGACGELPHAENLWYALIPLFTVIGIAVSVSERKRRLWLTYMYAIGLVFFVEYFVPNAYALSCMPPGDPDIPYNRAYNYYIHSLFITFTWTTLFVVLSEGFRALYTCIRTQDKG